MESKWNGDLTIWQCVKTLVPLVNIKIAGKWMFIPLKMVFIGIDPYPYVTLKNGCGLKRYPPAINPSVWIEKALFASDMCKSSHIFITSLGHCPVTTPIFETPVSNVWDSGTPKTWFQRVSTGFNPDRKRQETTRMVVWGSWLALMINACNQPGTLVLPIVCSPGYAAPKLNATFTPYLAWHNHCES